MLMNDQAEQIRVNAITLDRLHKRIHETFRLRDQSKADRNRWENACAEFHRTYPNLFFPGGSARWQAFLQRDTGELEAAVTFLEIDPWFFGSGYMKQLIWDRLKRAPLTSKQERRLETVAIAYVQHRVQREFWHMARYMRVRGSTAFWEAMTSLAAKQAGELSTRAGWLVLARQNMPVRNCICHELFRAKYEPGYKSRLPRLGESR
jgi:hypothetical protein